MSRDTWQQPPSLKFDAHQSQHGCAGSGPAQRVHPIEIELPFEVDLSRQQALKVRAILRVGTGEANLGRLIALPTDLQHGPPDVVATVPSGDASGDWELFDHP